jgi:DNA-binding NarL/FixJ family response regulator
MTASIHLGIVHRNRLFRECLASVLALQRGFQVTDFELGDRSLEHVAACRDINVWLIDAALPDGSAIDVTRTLQQHSPKAKVIALVPAAADDKIVQCVAAGAEGCILEDVSIDELQEGIRQVINGQWVYSDGIMRSMFRQMARVARETHWRMRASHTDLTSRELEILELVAAHQTNKQIAKQLSVSLHTVKNHVHHILEKLQVRNRNQAAEFARQHDWLS